LRRTVNIRDLARHLNISIGTVSRALNGKPYVDEATRARVLAAAAQFGYAPSFAGRSLRQGTSGMVAMMLPNNGNGVSVGDTIFMIVLEGLRRFFATKKLDLMVLLTSPDDRDFTYLRRVTDRRIFDGVIIADIQLEDPRIEYLLDRKVPFVAYGRSRTPGRYAWVDFDLEAAGADAADRLVRQGHRRIALAALSSDVNYGTLVEAGYRQALARHGMAVEDDLVIRVEPSEQGGYALGDRWLQLDPRPTAGRSRTLGGPRPRCRRRRRRTRRPFPPPAGDALRRRSPGPRRAAGRSAAARDAGQPQAAAAGAVSHAAGPRRQRRHPAPAGRVTRLGRGLCRRRYLAFSTVPQAAGKSARLRGGAGGVLLGL
jgi:DNA-binding LacI/PurR family transcriptional regulator